MTSVGAMVLLIVQRQGGVATGRAHRIRSGIWAATASALGSPMYSRASLRALATSLHWRRKPAIGDAVVRRGRAAGDHRSVNRQQRTGKRHAGGDNAQRLTRQGMRPVAVGDWRGQSAAGLR